MIVNFEYDIKAPKDNNQAFLRFKIHKTLNIFVRFANNCRRTALKIIKKLKFYQHNEIKKIKGLNHIINHVVFDFTY